MDDGQDVHEENLVDDQMAQAINDSATAVAGTEDNQQVPAPQPAPAPAPAPQDEGGQDDAAQQPVPAPNPVPEQTPEVQPQDDDQPEPAPHPEEPEQSPEPNEQSVADNPVNAGDSSQTDGELLGVKQQALEELSPLLDHLDLDPEQKFDTYMEIIRASDDKNLVKPAFEAAHQIEDEDKRARALLDVVNEVNYLTQHDE